MCLYVLIGNKNTTYLRLKESIYILVEDTNKQLQCSGVNVVTVGIQDVMGTGKQTCSPDWPFQRRGER